MANKIISIDLGGTTAKLAFVSNTGEIQYRWSVKTVINNAGKEIVSNLINSITEHMALFQLEEKDILGIGMGSPGTIDRYSQTVKKAYNLNWVDEYQVGELFRERFNVPFFIENDANVAALGESFYGAGKNQKDIVMLTLGTGVGGGVIVNNSIVSGNGGAGEIGHIIVDHNEEYGCTCGNNGCLESVASATGLLNIARNYSKEYVGDSPIKKLLDNGEELSSKIIFDFAKDEDYFSMHIVEHFSDYLGLACSYIANILNPELIIIGGGVSAAGEFLRSKIETYYLKYAFGNNKSSTNIVLSELGNDAALLGASGLVLNNQ